MTGYRRLICFSVRMNREKRRAYSCFFLPVRRMMSQAGFAAFRWGAVSLAGLDGRGIIMKEVALIEEQLRRLQKELRIVGDDTDRRILDMRAEVDFLKYELLALREFLSASNPTFAEQYPQILSKIIQEVNPEAD